MKKISAETWKEHCLNSLSSTNPEDFLAMVIERAALDDVPSYSKHRFYHNAFYAACLGGKKDHAKIILDKCCSNENKIDVSMGNYIVLSEGNLDSLKTYSSLVNMKPLDAENSDWMHLSVLAFNNKIDMYEYAISIGYKTDEDTLFDFVSMLINHNYFESAMEFSIKHNVNPSKGEWDSVIFKLAKNHKGSTDGITAIDRINKLGEIFPHRNILTSNPSRAILFALGNKGLEIAKYFIEKGAKIKPLLSKSGTNRLFSSDFGNAYIYSENINWLLDNGAKFSLENQKKLLCFFSHKDNGEKLLERMISVFNQSKIPWSDMLLNACGTHKNQVIKRMDHLSSLHQYNQIDYENALTKIVTGWGDLNLVNAVKSHFCVEYNQSALTKITQENSFFISKLDLLSDIINGHNVDIFFNDNEALKGLVFSLIRRGGKVDGIKLFLENGADIMCRNGEVYNFIKSYAEMGYRQDLLDVVNPYLEIENRIYLRGKSPSFN